MVGRRARTKRKKKEDRRNPHHLVEERDLVRAHDDALGPLVDEVDVRAPARGEVGVVVRLDVGVDRAEEARRPRESDEALAGRRAQEGLHRRLDVVLAWYVHVDSYSYIHSYSYSYTHLHYDVVLESRYMPRVWHVRMGEWRPLTHCEAEVTVAAAESLSLSRRVYDTIAAAESLSLDVCMISRSCSHVISCGHI